MWRCGSFILPVDQRCHVAGILNLSTTSRDHHRGERALIRASRMAEEGADIIEIGAESARPGASPVGVEAELEGVVEVVAALAGSLSVPVAVDTRKAQVAEAALAAGASIVNDISSLADPGMARVLAPDNCGVVLMHMRGTPESMQAMTEYDDVAAEVTRWLTERAAFAENAGISADRIALDQGLGLAKNRHQSLGLVNQIPQLARLGYPVMVAPSRKSFIGRTLNRPPAKRLMGTLAVVAWSVAAGASLLRVHDVRETVRVVRMIEAILSAEPSSGN